MSARDDSSVKPQFVTPDRVIPNPEQTRPFRRFFTEKRFHVKLANFARRAGKELILKALELYYAAKHPDTPPWARRTIYGALGYFISTIDFIPDIIPAAGFTDDLVVLTAAISAVAACITPEIEAQAKATLARWFPDGKGQVFDSRAVEVRQ